MWNSDDVIIAPATVRAGGGRAVVRLAGDGLGGLLDRLFLPAGGAWPEAAGVVAARFGDAQLTSSYGPLAVEVLFWPGPSGPIGGPLAEVQLPGCVPLVDALVARAVDLGARLARGGEFTLRAFLAGRIDLVQAEAVLSVVDARSPDELSEALDRMAGGLGGGLDAVRGTLLDLAGDIEAMIDFGEDAIGAVAMRDHLGSLAARTHAAAGSLDAVAGRLASRSAGAAERPRVVFCGPPNIGKSSLFNRLLGAAAALVADEPGTTRDWLEARYDVEGVECMLIDVAGIAPEGTTADGMTRASGEAAARQMAAADVLVVCTDATADAASSMPSASRAVRRIDVRTRCDRLPVFGPLPEGVIATSAIDGTGIDGLRRAIARAAAEAAGSPSYATVRLAEGVARARASLGEAAAELERAGESVDEAVVASHVGRAVAAIGEVTGREIGNDILDRIFSRHCIGK